MTPEVVYNLAVFAESLVLAESICLAPSIVKSQLPDALLSPLGPCSPIRLQVWTDNDLRSLFDDTIRDSLRDLKDTRLLDVLKSSPSEAHGARGFLNQWLTDVQDDPKGFLDTYSGSVFQRNDSASVKLLSQLDTCVSPEMPASRHLAQFLLRTGVVMALSQSLPYNPHSHRVKYVCEQFNRATCTSHELGRSLLAEVEQIIKSKVSSDFARSFLRRFSSFEVRESGLPLVLLVILSGARSPDDLLSLALQLRNSDAAIRFRQWRTQLIESLQSGSWKAHSTAEGEIQDARRVLNEELLRLYGPPRREVIKAMSAVAAVVPPEQILRSGWKELVIDATKKGAGALTGALNRIPDLLIRRKVALLLNLAKDRREAMSLNAMLAKVFHCVLTGEQLAVLRELHSRRRGQIE